MPLPWNTIQYHYYFVSKYLKTKHLFQNDFISKYFLSLNNFLLNALNCAFRNNIAYVQFMIFHFKNFTIL